MTGLPPRPNEPGSYQYQRSEVFSTSHELYMFALAMNDFHVRTT